MKLVNQFFILGLGLTLFACGTSKNEKGNKKNGYSINTQYMDLSTSPEEDFYQFANGTWLENTSIPSTASSWSSFSILEKQNNEKLTLILNEAVEKGEDASPNLKLIGDYYSSMTDEKYRELFSEKQIDIIQGIISRINKLEDLPSVFMEMNLHGIPTVFSISVEQDLGNNERYAPYLFQDGLGMPSKDYYTHDAHAEIREQYIIYAQRVFELFGYKDPRTAAKNAYQFEETLAKTMMSPAELRSIEKIFNPMQIEEMKVFNLMFDAEYFASQYGNGSVKSFIVGQPKHLVSIAGEMKQMDFQIIKDFIAWKYMNHYSRYMGKKLEDLNDRFYHRTLSGIKDFKPMNEKAIKEMTDNAMQTTLAKEFVARHFPAEAKEKINTLVDHLVAAYENRINQLDWMTNDTKAAALTKLHAIKRKLGYPETWKNISGLEISKIDYISNIDNCNIFSFKDNLSKLSRPIDKEEWGMPAHMVNAYYNPLRNEIAFPAGIMQAPFFDIDAEDAVNYGGIGMVIGHEITHGFDDMGSQFAADGSYTNWWDEADAKAFQERTKKLGDIYKTFCPINGHCVNPDLTMGENIADLGGVTMAYHAYKMTKEYKSGKTVDNYTPSQRFFIAYAQLWRTNYKDKELLKRLGTDPHSPAKYRVNGPLMNSPEFFDAFKIPEGSKMRKNAKEISIIW